MNNLNCFRSFTLFVFVLFCSVSLTYAQNGITKENYLLKTSKSFSLTEADVADWMISSEHTSSTSGVHHVYYTQQYGGIEIYQAVASAHFLAEDKVFHFTNAFEPNLADKISGSSNPGIEALEAIESVAEQLGLTITEEIIMIEDKGGVKQEKIYSTGGISKNNIPTKLVYQKKEDGSIVLTWDLSINVLDGQDWWHIRADANSGEILSQVSWVNECEFGHDHDHNEVVMLNIEDPCKAGGSPTVNLELESNENIINNISGSPLVGNYTVYPVPLQSPLYGGRSMIANPDDPIASPFGWHDTNGAAGAEFTDTRGNNVDAFEDGDNPGYRPDGGPGLVFDFPINTVYTNGDQSEDASLTNLFYWNNIIHDIIYQYGFDEASGNFQTNNYGNGGIGTDHVLARGQSGILCNAFFGTPPDGSSGNMYMFVCGSRDGNLDNMVVIHEYAHGISNRLTGGGGNTGCLGNTEQMGEGWSDYYGVALTMQGSDGPTTNRTAGNWLFGQNANGPGIRPYPYTTDISVNPDTYSSIIGTGGPHRLGVVWTAMLWEMTWELINTHGFDPDFYNGTGGNNIALALVTEGMKLQPCSPGFVDGRDAILAADQALYGGANSCEIWTAFAKRGLGEFADQGSSFNRNDGIEDFTVPATACITVPPPGEAGDSCPEAGEVFCGNVVSGSTVGASTDFAPFCGTSNTAPGVWYRMIGDGSCVTITTCSPNTNYDSKLTVYSGNCNGLTCVAGNDDDFTCPNSGLQSTVKFTSQVGVEYFILVHGFGSGSGNFEMTITCQVAPPNDLVCQAEALTLGVSANAIGECAGAEPGEVNPGPGTTGPSCNSQDGWCSFEINVQNSLWYTFVAPPSGVVDISTDDTDDAQLALWSVGDCADFGTFTEVAANDDGGAGLAPFIDDACVTPGDTYYVQIDGFNNNQYNTNLTVDEVLDGVTAVCQDITVMLDASGNASITGDDIDGGSDAICDIESLDASITDFSCADIGLTIPVVLTVTATTGATATCTALVTVVETACNFLCPAPEIITTTDPFSDCSAFVTVPQPIMVGACDLESLTNDYNGTSDASDVYPMGTTEVTFTILTVCGTEVTCTVTITVEDNTPPQFTSCPDDMTIDLDAGECGQVFSFAVEAEDECNIQEFSMHQNGGLTLNPSNFTTNGVNVAGGGVVCGFTTEVVGYGRLFDLQALGVAPTADFTVTSVDFVLNFSSPSVANTISIYSFPAGTTIPTMSAQTLLGSEAVNPPVNGGNQLVTLTFTNPIIVPAGEMLFVTWEAVSNVFGGGSILASEGGPFGGPPETAPSYVFGCPSLGLFPDYTDVDGFFPGYSAMIQVNGATLDPTVPVVPDPANPYMSGDMLPIGGPYCFAYTATDLSGNVSTCEFCITVNEFPEDLQLTELICNDLVILSLDENCEITVGGDLVLEGGPYGCYDTYDVFVMDAWGQPMDSDQSTPGTQLNEDAIGGTHSVLVTDTDTGNQCWGYLEVEDKQIPPLECQLLIVPCDTDPVPGSDYSDVLDPAYSQASNACTASCSDIDNGYSILLNPDRTVMDDMEVPAGTTWDVTKVRIVMTTAPWAPTGLTISFRQDAGGSPGAVFATQDIPAADIVFVDTGDNSFGFDWYSAEANITPVSLAGGSSYWLEVGVFETSSNYFWESKNSPINGSEAWVDYSDFGGLQPASNIFGVQADMVFDIAIAVDATIEFPIPDGATYSPTNFPSDFQGPWTIFNYDPCGTAQLEYYDTYTEESCDGEFAKVLYRTWTATDESGNVTTCVDTFNFRLSTMTDVILPPDYDGLEDNEDPLSCEGGFAVDDYGNPSPSVTGYPGGPGCFNISSNYDDIIIPICGGGVNSYKVLRQWVILDWCTGDIATHNQIIKVLDSEGPEIDASDVLVSTGIWSCSYEINADDFINGITDNCDDEIEVNLVPAEGSYLPKGIHDVLVQAVDDCGNVSEQIVQVTVADQVPPVVIVDDELNITLTTDGYAKAYADFFDEGSYDMCGPVTIEVRRISPNPCGLSPQYSEYVEFCCEDVPLSPVIVEFRASDHSGNSNTGWIYVTVEDKLPPAIVCPGDITMNCLDNYQAIVDAAGTPVEDLPDEVTLLLGTPQWGSACGNEVSYTAFANVDECGEGSINVTWIINTDSGQSNGCLQRVFIVKENQNTLECDDITFPSGSAEANTYGPYPFCEVNDNQNDNDDDQPAIQVTDCGDAIIVAPELDNDQLCTAIGISMDADTFNFAEGACMKIVVHWEVIDHCVFEENYVDPVTGEIDPFNSYNGYFEFFAEYDIFDNEGPELECIDEYIVNCTETFSGPVTINATDNCSDEEVFGYAWQFDLGNDGTVDAQGAGENIFAGDVGLSYFPFGEHRVIWNVNDGCGNLSNKTCVFDIGQEDTKAPTAYCFDGLSTAVMAEAGTVTLWAVDFDAGSFDDCDDEVTITMIPEVDAENSNDPWADSEAGWTFDCSYIPSGISVTLEVRIYATDNEGNYDYCSATLRIEDNLDACDDEDVQSTVGGRFATEVGEGIDDAEVQLGSDSPEYPRFLMTEDGGNYEFINNPMFYDYAISGTRDFGYLDGVSTLDLVFIQRYILGQHEFDSAYKVIAADINSDEKVSAIDLLQLRKLILGLYENDDLPNNESWRFVDADQEFADLNNPWPIDEVINIEPLDNNLMSEDMVGVKIGDVNGSIDMGGLNSSEVRVGDILNLEIMESEIVAGKLYRIDVRSQDFDEVYGYQFTLNFETNALAYVGTEGGILEMGESNFGLNRVREGIITTSWHDVSGISVGEDEVLFTMVFQGRGIAQMSEVISINSRVTKAEAYLGMNLDAATIGLVFRTDKGTMGSDQIALYQNEPNPFNNETVIGFNLPEGGLATITVYDVTGKLLKEVKGDFERGYNSVGMDRSELGTSGVLYYQLESGDFVATKKMIILE